MIHMRSTAEPFDAMVHIKQELLGALRSVSANIPHQGFRERFTRSRRNYSVSAAPVNGK